jgi:predicted O-linked N-acetylglucosamine transferase (SPINDLY family)/glycosyltransferase involved in cell wall biosynthesis
VTNYNYGHYVEACLNSLFKQTSPADEIIVVNDGSTDGSADILAQFNDVKVIDQPNGGQAAAFNTGFAASTSDIVIFVDADDKLHPSAIQVIRRLWTHDISALSYGLSMIDGQGESVGQYAMDLPDIDLLPRLLSQLAIPFMPTTGNAFRREAIEWAFPLPTEQWRISADALLIRAAVLAAPVRHVRQVLGAYRVHGQNNYFRAEVSGPWKANRGLRDIARTGLDLIKLADRAERTLSRTDRRKILLAAVRSQLKAEVLAFDPVALSRFKKRALELCQGPRFYFSIALYLFAAGYSRQVRQWAVDPRGCPRVLIAMLECFRGRAINLDLSARVEPRAPYDTSLPRKGSRPIDPIDWVTGPEWTRNYASGGADLCAAMGSLVFRRIWDGPVKMSLHLAPCSDIPVKVSLFHNGLPLDSFDLNAPRECSFTLPEASCSPPDLDLIEIRTDDLGKWQYGVFSRMWRKAHRLQVRAIMIDPVSATPAAAVLKMSDGVPMTNLGDVVQKHDGSVLTGERVIGSGENLSLAVPSLAPPYCLSMRLSQDQVPGHLSVTLNGQAVFSGDLVAGGTCLIEMPQDLTVFNPAVLEFGFRPESFLEEPVVMLQDLGWLPQGAEGRYGLPTLSPGGWAGPGTGRRLSTFLGWGWQHTSDGTAKMLGNSAQLILSQAVASEGAVLRLNLEPMDSMSVHEHIVVVVTVDGNERAAAQLAGQAIIDVDMDGVLAGPRHKVEVVIYAATRPSEDEQAGDHGGLKLNGIGLAPRKEMPNLFAAINDRSADMAIKRLLSKLNKSLHNGASLSDLATQRANLKVEISRLSTSAAVGSLTAKDLSTMAVLSAKLPLPKGGGEALPISQIDWMRDLAQRILSGPAFVKLRNVVLNELPELTPEFAATLGAYLVADPAIGAGKTELRAYQDHLVDMMEQARAALATTPESSPLGTLASEMISAFRARQLLFSDLPLRPHVKAFGRALEAKLLREGHDLFSPQVPDADMRRSKRRIGVLLHNTEPSPETWIWRAILRKLPPESVEVTLFLTEQNAAPSSGFEGCEAVGLAGHSLSSTVATIRRANLDVVILGANFYGHCFMTEVCAHKLAPRQIALSAVFPATTGLSSVDTFVLGKSVAPKRVESDYCENVMWAPGAGQAFDLPSASESKDAMKDVTRRRMGVAPNDVVLVSGAMQDKIGPDVLHVWAQALAAEPKAVLVLYPFAASWQQSYDAPAFIERVTSACEAQNVDPRRVKILPPIPNKEVLQVLAAADVYLDSFPYSGATTTVEAMRCGLPVVALQGQTQRGQQAAGWLVEFGLKDLVAKTHREYVKIVADLASDAECRAQLQSRIADARNGAMKQHNFAEWFEAFLLARPKKTNKELEAPRYLFHHMPKTGGTSLKRVFTNWFDIAEDYREPWAYFMPPKLDIGQLGPNSLLCGHFAGDMAPLAERYPVTLDPQRWRKITFLRDPLERAISIHAYEKKLRLEHDQTYKPQPLGEFLRSSDGIFLLHFECDENNWRSAIDSYWFIGTLERLPESLDYLATELGKPVPGILPHENSTARDEGITEDDIAAFRANNAIEFEIYDAVASRLDALLSQHTRD